MSIHNTIFPIFTALNPSFEDSCQPTSDSSQILPINYEYSILGPPCEMEGDENFSMGLSTDYDIILHNSIPPNSLFSDHNMTLHR